MGENHSVKPFDYFNSTRGALWSSGLIRQSLLCRSDAKGWRFASPCRLLLLSFASRWLRAFTCGRCDYETKELSAGRDGTRATLQEEGGSGNRRRERRWSGFESGMLQKKKEDVSQKNVLKLSKPSTVKWWMWSEEINKCLLPPCLLQNTEYRTAEYNE